MGYFPFFVDIEGKNGLIVGGGKVAAHKISKLLPFCPRLKVVASDITDEVKMMASQNDNMEIVQKSIEQKDLDGSFFVIAASDDRSVNTLVSGWCAQEGIPVNVVDDKDKCSFIFPSLIKKGKLTVGISTQGASPEVAATVKNETARLIPSNIEDILDYLSSIRQLAKEHISDGSKRSKFLKDTARECMDLNAVFSEAETMDRIAKYAGGDSQLKGRVALVGAGCGGYDLVTLKGLYAIRNADVIVYDDLIDNRLLEFACESCEKMYVGKRNGRHSYKQDEINQILISKAFEGKYVVRLKGGDPYVFGRASEEICALCENEIKYEYIPGISSAIAAPGLAGIPVTSRNVSRSFHVITGHTSDTSDTLPENIETLAKLNGTLVFLMGIENIDRISQALIGYGKDKDTPAAVIHADVDNTAKVIKATLSDIAKKVNRNNIKTPAVIVFGDVVGM